VTDVQLYLVIGVPTLTVFAGILINVVQYNATIARFTNFESRLVSFSNRIGGADSGLDARFQQLENKLDVPIRKVTDLDNRLTRIEAKLGIG
jgi:hypothetical protein